MSNESTPSSISEEISNAKRLFPSVQVLTATRSFLIATYERTPYTRIKTTLTFPDNYPSHPLIVNIDQDAVVPPGLKKKLEKELNSLASEKSAKSSEQQFDQVCVVWQHLVSFVDDNLFVPCWKERRKCVDLIQNQNSITTTKSTTATIVKNKKQSTLSIVSESKGKLKLALHNEAYSYICSITIDPAYPDYSLGKSCSLQLTSTNFPKSIENMLTSQAQEIVRRMQEGLNSERALQMSNPIKVPKNFHLNTEQSTEGNSRITNQTIQNIKHDTEALKRVSALRHTEASSVRAPGDNGYVNHKALAKERKDARRTIQKLTEEERAADLQSEEKERLWKLEERKRLSGYYDVYGEESGGGGGGRIVPQPSLFVLVTFLVERIKGLVKQKCPCCGEPVLPSNPEELNSMYDKQSCAKLKRKRRPMRTYCGCWYHKSCLNTFLTEPPFGAVCPTVNCGRRVFHPDWPGDIKQMEREWAAKQARMREIEDAMLFL